MSPCATRGSVQVDLRCTAQRVQAHPSGTHMPQALAITATAAPPRRLARAALSAHHTPYAACTRRASSTPACARVVAPGDAEAATGAVAEARHEPHVVALGGGGAAEREVQARLLHAACLPAHTQVLVARRVQRAQHLGLSARERERARAAQRPGEGLEL